MADYKAVFSKPRRIASAISSYFVRSSSGTDRATSGTYSTVSSGTPAFDRKDGLILEAAATNLILRSSEFDHSAWTRYLCTVTANAATAPDGTTTADLVQFSGQYGSIRESAPSLTAGTKYTYSVWCKVASGTRQYHVYDNVGSELGSFTATTAWARYQVTFTAPNTTAIFAIQDRSASGFVDTYLWGAQLETGSFATSYIPTTSATVTRAASYLGPIPVGDMGIASQTNEYSIAVAWKPQMPSGVGTDAYRHLVSIGATANHCRFDIYYNSYQGTVQWRRIELGSNLGGPVVGAGELTWNAGDTLFARASWGATNGAILVTQKVGASNIIDTNTGATLKAAAASAMTHVGISAYIQTGTANTNASADVYLGFRIWDTALSQAQLEALTTADLDGTTYLTAWSTELGSDPPGTTPISDENITSGSLDWWRFGESGNTSENTKSGASYLGSSANINTPAFGQYSGSNQYQAPLIVYTDGTSPSSGSSRSYSSTGVASAGRSNVVTSSGKPLWIHILAGGYDGAHQHVLTTSDSSSPVFTRTNTTGAGNVKFWETIVYWGGAASSTLTIASTAVSGSVGLQLAAITVFPVDPTITSLGATAIDPGVNLTVNHLGFASAPTAVTYNSVSEAFTGSPSATQSVMTGIPVTDFVLGGHHAATRWQTNYSLTLSDGYESASYTVQVDPTLTANVNDFDQRAGTQYYAPTGSADGDDFYVTWVTGGGALTAAGAYFAPTTLPAQGQVRWYDVSAASWQALYLTDYFSSAASIVEGVVMEVVRPAVKSIVEAIT